MSEQKIECIDDTLPGFIEHLKSLPSQYYGEDNAWEDILANPDFLSTFPEIGDVFDKLAAEYLRDNLPTEILRDAWLNSSSGSDAYEHFQETSEFDQEEQTPLPASYIPSVWEQACAVYDILINEMFGEIERELERRELALYAEDEDDDEADDEAEESNGTKSTAIATTENLEQQGLDFSNPAITPEALLNDMLYIAIISEGVNNEISLYSSVLSSSFYVKLTIDSSTMSETLSDTADDYYVPVEPIDLKTLATEGSSRGKMISVMEMSKGRKNIDHNEHGTGWCDHIFHPYAWSFEMKSLKSPLTCCFINIYIDFHV